MAVLRRSRHAGLTNLSALFFLFCIFTATAQAASAVLGIDFGTEYIKATLVKPGIPLEIVLTKDSRRKESSAVAFKPLRKPVAGAFPERLYGSDAMALAGRFPGDVYPNLKALLGLPVSNSKVTEYKKGHPALNIVADGTRDTVAFKSATFGKEESPFLVEEILAMELQSIQKNAEALAGKGSSVKDIVITVPPFFALEEKRAIKLAADLAGLRVLSLLSDGLAVGLNYATSRQFPSINEGGKAEHNLVFDMGAGSTKATVLKFQGRTVKDVGKFNKTIQEVSVIGTGWDRTLGGDALNAIIVDDMIATFVESKAAKAASVKAESVQAHGRAMAKLMKEAERLRHVLSANAETQGNFEGLFEDIDFKYKITRAHFEKLTDAFADKVLPAIETACSRAKISIKDLDSIILHGGAVRTPFIQRQLEKIVGGSDKIRSNVNADEAAVFGAGFKGAGLSPSFRVKDIRASEAAGYVIGMKWTNIHKKPQHQAIFQPQSSLGVEKTVSFQNQEDFTISFYQHVGANENVSPGSAEKQIAAITTKNLTASVAELKGKGCSNADIVLKVGIKLRSEDGEVEIVKNVLQCEYEEEDKKESVVDSVKGLFGFGSKDKAQEALDDSEQVEATGTETASSSATAVSAATSASSGEKDAKPKLTKKTYTIPIGFTVELQGYPQLSSAELTRMKTRLAAFDDSDRSRLLREEALNQLEGFTYRVRDLIEDASFMGASTDAERSSLDTLGKAASEWLYGDGAEATRETLKARLKELKDIVNPIELRRSEATKRPAQIKALQDALNQTKSFIDTVKAQIEVAASAASSVVLGDETSSSTSTTAESKTTGDFDDLEDEPTSTTSSVKSTYTPPPPPTYSDADVTPVQEMYDNVMTWLTEKLAEQDALPANANPVILVKELAEKAASLNKAGMDLLMKGMRSATPPPKKSSTVKRAKTTKTPKAKATKGAKAAKKGEAGKDKLEDLKDKMEDMGGGVKKGKIGLGDFAMPEGVKMLNVGEDGELPSEEEILRMLRDAGAEDGMSDDDIASLVKESKGSRGDKHEMVDEGRTAKVDEHVADEL